MEQQTFSLKLITLFVAIALLPALKGTCQSKESTKRPCQPNDSSQYCALPAMFIPKTDPAVQHYRRDRRKVMERKHKNEPDSFLLKGWMNMFEYFNQVHSGYNCLRAYIGAFTEDQPNNIDKKDQLVIVFVPTFRKGGDYDSAMGYYRFQANDSFSSQNVQRFIVTRAEVKKWVDNYSNHFLKYMSRKIDKKNKDNLNKSGKRSDTYGIAFCRDLIEELKLETSLIHTDLTNTKRINLSPNISFALATHKDTKRKGFIFPVKRSGRLFLQLDFTDEKNAISYLDDMYHACIRDKPEPHCQVCGRALLLAESILGLDKAQLCPPASNCPITP